ncbi:MAG: hypothetical protein ACRETL_02110 [Gammaproteobacteria bacterium]
MPEKEAEDPYAESRRAACRAFYHRHVAKGLCGRCSAKARPGYTTCDKHKGGPPRGPTLTKQRCSECDGLNHNRRTCPKLKPAYVPENECSYCHEAGHNIRACEKLMAHEAAYRAKQAEAASKTQDDSLVQDIMSTLGL